VWAGIDTLILYLDNILRNPTISRYFTINKSKRVYRHAFDGFESEIHAFLIFLGLRVCISSFYALICVISGFQPSFAPSVASKASEAAMTAGTSDGLESCLVLPVDFCWETVSEAHRTLHDYRKLPSIERWNFFEAKVVQADSPLVQPGSKEEIPFLSHRQ